MDLNSLFPPNEIPTKPYIGLFGNHHNNWLKWVMRVLDCQGVSANQIYDSTDRGWRIVNDLNGDELQDWITELVKRQHAAMSQATCIIFSMDTRNRIWNLDNLTEDFAVPTAIDDAMGSIFAARCELGWLAGKEKVKTFVWIPDDLVGRNYLRSVVTLYRNNLDPVANLYQASLQAAKHLSST